MLISYTCSCEATGVIKENAIARIKSINILNEEAVIIKVNTFWSLDKCQEGLYTSIDQKKVVVRKNDDEETFNDLSNGDVLTKCYNYLLSEGLFKDGKIL